MKKTVTIQTKNVDIEVRDKAEKIVRDAGLSSLQEILRVIIIDIANGELPIKFSWNNSVFEDIRKAREDYKKGRYTVLKKNQKLSDILKP